MSGGGEINRQKRPLSNLEFLQKGGVLPESMTLEEAVKELTDPLNCVECIALDQCADTYGTVTGESDETGCMETVRAYLKQDHKEASENGNGQH